MNKTKNIHSIYLDMQEQYTNRYGEKTLVLMQIGGFHEAYGTKTRGHDLFKIGSMLNMICTKKNKEIDEISEECPYMLGFPSIAKHKYIKILVDNGFTVIIVDQTSPPPKPKREVTGIYSPGTYIDTTADTNYMISFFIEEEQSKGQIMPCIGMTALDITTGDLCVNEAYASEGDATYAFTEALRFIHIYNPKEIVIYHKQNTKTKQNQTQNRITNLNNVDCESQKQSLSKDKIVYYLELEYKCYKYYTNCKQYNNNVYQIELLNKIYKTKNDMMSIIERLNLEKYTYARTSCVALLDYTFQHDETLIKQLKMPIIQTDSNVLIIGNDAIKQLNIVDNNNLDTGNSSFTSLFNTINNTETAMGRRYLKKRLTSPSTNPEIIKQYYDMSDSFLKQNNAKLISKISESLNKINDIEKIVRKINIGKMQPYELASMINDFKEFLKIMKYVRKGCEKNSIFVGLIKIIDTTTQNRLNLNNTQKRSYNELKNEIKSAIKYFDETFEIDELKKQNLSDINKSFYKRGLHKEIDNIENEIEFEEKFCDELCKELRKIMKDDTKTNLDAKIKKHETKEGVMIVISKNKCKVLQHKLKSIDTLTICGKQLKYTEFNYKELKGVTKISISYLDEKQSTINKLQNKLQNTVLAQFAKSISYIDSNYSNVSQLIIDFVSLIDFILSNVKTSTKYKYVKPRIEDTISQTKLNDDENIIATNSFINCENLRHPIIERLIDYEYVPHNINLGQNGSNNINGMLIYGINSCGKCFHGDTKILMHDTTYKYAKDIQINDCLMGDDGTKRTVMSLTCGQEMLFKIKIDNNDDLIVTANHILCLRNKQTNNIIETTIHEYLLNPKQYFDHMIYSNAILDTTNKSQNANDITFAQQFGMRFDFRIDKRIGLFYIKKMSIAARIAFFTSMTANRKIRQKFDKHIGANQFVMFVPLCTNSDIINDLLFLLRSIGYVAIYKFGRICFWGNNHQTYQLFKFGISLYKIDNYYGFETDGNHRFMLHNCIVTHNSSLMKSVGTNIIMAQAGLYVPATKFVFSPFKSLYARITGNDNIFKGQSSFTVEMTELNTILEKADQNTLIIGDEPARGTENVSATALVASTLVELSNCKTNFIFATHLHDLPKIKQVKELTNLKIYHLSVEYDKQKDMLIFSRLLQEGQGSMLYGITIANKIIKNAKFIELAIQIKNDILHIESGIVPTQKSNYNKSLLMINCNICGKEFECDKDNYKTNLETHHIIHQNDYKNELSDVSDNKKHILKNCKANLAVLCKKCHVKIHNENIEIKGFMQTSNGKQLIFK
jgi:DNA mismatch repair ATPase MutS